MNDHLPSCPKEAEFELDERWLTELASRDCFINRSYLGLLRQAARLKDDHTGEAFVFLAHAAYGWMPRMLSTVEVSSFSVSRIFADIRGVNSIADVTYVLEKLCSPPVNASWVGTSKTLHFIRPEWFPIWDINVAYHFGLNRPDQLQRKGCYIAYSVWLHGETAHRIELIEKMQERFNENFGYKPTAIRCLELVLFHSGKKHRVEQKARRSSPG